MIENEPSHADEENNTNKRIIIKETIFSVL
jgi:hypothetical protein